MSHVLRVPMTTSAFQTRFLVSPQEMQNLVEYYKGRLTENAQLNEAARLAAKQHAILNSELPAGNKAARMRPVAAQLRKLTRRVRQGSTPSAAAAALPLDKEEGLVRGPLDTMLKTLLKGQSPRSATRTPSDTPRAQPILAPRRKKSVPAPEATTTLAPATSRAQKLLQASRDLRKKRTTEVERLKPLPGWEDWHTPHVRRRLHEQDLS